MPTDALRFCSTTNTTTPATAPTADLANTTGSTPIGARWAVMVVLAALVAVSATMAADVAMGAAAPAAQQPVVNFDQHVVSFPDVTGDIVGGAAARLHIDGATPTKGELFALFAKDGSQASARVYETTPYTLVRSSPHPEMVAANGTAAAVVTAITGDAVAEADFTSAPAGGYSAGLTYAIAYLNEAADGGFTGDLRVAATGSLDDDGYVDRVDAIGEKTAAANLAGADVMFTSVAPAYFTVDAYGARFVGDLYRARHTGTPLAAERNWEEYEALGQQRPDGEMDIVAVAHVGDVAAYLCGAGSEAACAVQATLAERAIGTLASPSGSGATTGNDVATAVPNSSSLGRV